MGRFNQAVRKGKHGRRAAQEPGRAEGSADDRVSPCVHLGYQICRNSGLSDDELLALPHYRRSDLFSEAENRALDYTVAVMPHRSRSPTCCSTG